MMKKEDLILRLVGAMAIALSILGLYYNFSGLSRYFANPGYDPETPYFESAFTLMSAVCIACYIALVIIGAQFLRGRSKFLHIFTGILIFEVIYFYAAAVMSFVPKLGMSIAAALGVSNGGLVFQGLILFPIWAPLAVNWAARRLDCPSRKESLATS